MKALPERLTGETITLNCDRDEKKTEFVIAPLCNLVDAFIQDRITRASGVGSDEVEINFAGGTYKMLVVAFGVQGFSGLTDEHDHEVKPEFTTIKIGSLEVKRLTNACVNRIPAIALTELAERIQLLSGLPERTGDEVRKFRKAGSK